MLNKLSSNDRAAVSVLALFVFLGAIGAAAVVADKALDTYRAVETARVNAQARPIEVRTIDTPMPPTSCLPSFPDGGIETYGWSPR